MKNTRNRHNWTDEEIRKIVWQQKQGVKLSVIAMDMDIDAICIKNMLFNLKKKGDYDKVVAELNDSNFSISQHQKIADAVNKMEETAENPTEAPLPTIETGAISENRILADTLETSQVMNASAALHTAKKKPPQSVMDAVQQSVDCNLKLLDDLTERIQTLMEQRELLKHTNAEMLAWMQEAKA